MNSQLYNIIHVFNIYWYILNIKAVSTVLFCRLHNKVYYCVLYKCAHEQVRVV